MITRVDRTRTDDGQPKNFLRAWLLLLLTESPAHGYDLVERLDSLDVGRDAGSLYRALRALEHEGLVRSTWEASLIGPDRRRYVVTETGQERLRAWADVLEAVQASLAAFLDRCRSVQSVHQDRSPTVPS
jgi:poly-beta-hydroxybutyrate-responsive repressor